MAAPNLTEIEYVIQELKTRESSYENYLLLAAFCICRDELMGETAQPVQFSSYSMASEPVAISRSFDTLGRYGDSEFLAAVDGKAPEDAEGHGQTHDGVAAREPETVRSISGPDAATLKMGRGIPALTFWRIYV